MTEEEYKKFCKRYDKFKKNNLPTPFWDDERQTYEYVRFYKENGKDNLEVYSELTDALGNIACAGLYYSFTSKNIISEKENDKIITKVVSDHFHAHTFDEVVKNLYYYPESFHISKDDEQFYSKQEINYLKKIQKYLLFIGLKDLDKERVSVSRYRNKTQSKYENVFIQEFTDQLIDDIEKEKRNFAITDWHPEYLELEKYKPGEFQALIVDKKYNFKMLIEYAKSEVKLYKDIKMDYKNDKLNDNDKIVLRYFKILKKF